MNLESFELMLVAKARVAATRTVYSGINQLLSWSVEEFFFDSIGCFPNEVKLKLALESNCFRKEPSHSFWQFFTFIVKAKVFWLFFEDVSR
jgi:hypothetical protein